MSLSLQSVTRTEEEREIDSDVPVRSTRLAILNNFIPPYWKPVFACLSARYPNLRVLISTPMEPNRSWDVDWQALDVVLQKTATFRGKWRHPKGFKEPLFIHVPIDTVAQLKRFKADVVLSAEMGVRTLLSLVYRKLHPASKLIIWAEIAESTEQGRGALRHVLRRLLAKHADAFIVFGESGARYVRTLCVPDKKIFKVPYATDVNRFARTPATRDAEQAHRLLYVGQLIERKGLIPFLAVLSRWATAHPLRTITFQIAGEGPLRPALAATPLPSNLRLELLGNIRYDELSEVYGNAGTFVLPTLADTWGLVVNEALASGLPVLGSVYSQAVEMLIADGENGWIFRPDDAEQTYRALDLCMNVSFDRLDEMRQCARQTAVKQTPEYVARLIDEAIVSCMNTDPNRRGRPNVR